jgi:hypothetical protein
MIELGGRKLQVIASANIEHDCWMAAKIREAGLDRVAVDEHQPVADVVELILDRVQGSGLATVLIGSLLAPADLDLKKWRPAVALEMIEFVRELTATEDKVVFRGLLAQAIAGFFRSALASLATSPTSSPRHHAGGAPSHRSASAAPSTSANGT